MRVTPSKPKATVTMKTSDSKSQKRESNYQWWLAKSDKELSEEMIATAAFLKETQAYRYKAASIYARLYGNTPLFSFMGSNIGKMDNGNSLPIDRPTFNLVQSACDTLVSRISQSRPTPVFLTDNSDYKQRTLAKKLNNFILGEFFRAKAYQKAEFMLRDALVEGTGCIKVFETPDHKVGLERTLLTELSTDPNESIYGEPRTLYHHKLVDRAVLIEAFPKLKSTLTQAEAAYPDNSSNSSRTVSDQVMVVEGWHLRSGPDATDGRHTIACSAGMIHDEQYDKDSFPFVFLHYSTRLLGFWAQGLAEQLMGTQLEINRLLYTISMAIKLVGVPRVFVEDGSKVVKAHLNNEVGAIVTYQGTKPQYEVAPCIPAEMYAQLQRLIDYGYQQCGVSALQASSTKPAGLNSGEAIRSYDDISTDRFAALSRRYDNVFIDLSYQMIGMAKDIAEREKKYSTVYPAKNGTKVIDLPKLKLEDDPYVIQCFNMSSLPRDPAGRMQKVTEMIQSGMISIKEGRRLLDYPDLDQIEKLANASEERIFQILDEMVEDGKYAPPDPFMDLQLATELTTQYYNLYSSAKLEEERCQMLRDFFTQVQTLIAEASAPPPGAMAPAGAPGPGNLGPTPQAVPEAPPVSPILPNAPQAA